MRVLALDLGERRTGVALSDSLGWLATPLTVLQCHSREAELAAVVELVRRHQVKQVVVGYPLSLDGSIGPQAQRVDKYAAQLRTHLPEVPVILWDERLSTAQAERLVHEAGRRVQRERIDAAAAAVILQGYLDAQQSLAVT
jgi:putative Holliday junction resolvase